MPQVLYEVKITFEDNTKIGFNGEGIQEVVRGLDAVVRHRHNKLVHDINTLVKEYIINNVKDTK